MHPEYTRAVERFINHMRLVYPTSSTASHYEHDLKLFGQSCDQAPRLISRQEITAFITAQLRSGLSGATVNRRLATLRRFFEYLADEADDESWTNPVVWRLHRVKTGDHLPRDLPEAVVRQFWQQVSQGPVRDQAMVALMLDVGLRVGEVAGLCVNDYEAALTPDALAALRIRGKGDKERRVWLTQETAGLIEAYLAQRPQGAYTSLFLTRRQRGFSVRGIQDRVKHYTVQSGLEADQVSCHRLRHTFARRMAEASMPLPSLSHWLGHSQLKTTQIYIDGANPQIRADYEAAMEALSRPAECPPAPEPAGLAVDDEAEPVSEAGTAAPPLPVASMLATLAELPTWLQTLLVSFLVAKQARWQAPYQRRRTQQWLGELRRAWTWLVDPHTLHSLADLRREDLKAYLAHLHAQELSAHTLNHFLTTFWAFLHFCEEQGASLSPALYRLERPTRPDSLPRPLSEAEFARLEQTILTATAAQPTADALLDRCWFLLLADTGLRIGEMCALTVDAYDASAHTVFVRTGKGLRDRLLFLSERAAQALDTHLATRSDSLTRQQPLLVYRQRALTAAYVRNHLHAYASQAAVPQVTPHRLRHTFATRMLNSGMPLATLQKLMGHRHMDTTMGYAALYETTMRRHYEAALARIGTDTLPAPDWSLWGPTLEEVFSSLDELELTLA